MGDGEFDGGRWGIYGLLKPTQSHAYFGQFIAIEDLDNLLPQDPIRSIAQDPREHVTDTINIWVADIRVR